MYFCGNIAYERRRRSTPIWSSRASSASAETLAGPVKSEAPITIVIPNEHRERGTSPAIYADPIRIVIPSYGNRCHHEARGPRDLLFRRVSSSLQRSVLPMAIVVIPSEHRERGASFAIHADPIGILVPNDEPERWNSLANNPREHRRAARATDLRVTIIESYRELRARKHLGMNTCRKKGGVSALKFNFKSRGRRAPGSRFSLAAQGKP